MWVLLALMVGIACGAAAGTHAAAWWIVGGAAAVVAAAFFSWRGGGVWFRTCALVGVVMLGAGWFGVRARWSPTDDVARLAAGGPVLVAVEAVVTSAPVVSADRRGRLSSFVPTSALTGFEARVLRTVTRPDGGEPRDASGLLRVRIDGEAAGLSPGVVVRLSGVVRAVPPPTNPGQPDGRWLARARGISGWMDVDSAGSIRVLGAGDEGVLTRARVGMTKAGAWLSARARSWADRDVGEDREQREARSLLRAVLLGEEDRELEPLREAFARLGLTHILSISGLNLVLLAGAVMLALRVAGDTPRVEAVVGVLAIGLYLLVIPVRAPVLRAAIMVLSLLVAEAAGRRYDRVTVLAWTGVIVLIWNPAELLAPGFQLSYGVVWALIVLTGPLRRRVFGPPHDPGTASVRGVMLDRAKDAVSAAVVAWLAASPLIALHAGVFSPWGAVMTVVLGPLVAVLMGAGYLTLVVATVVPALGDVAVAGLDALAWVLARAVRTFDGVPGAVVYLPLVSAWWCAAASGMVVWWLARWQTVDGWKRALAARWRARRGGDESVAIEPLVQPVWHRGARWGATLIVAAWFVAAWTAPALPGGVVARLDTLDVGDGACHLLRVRDRESGEIHAVLFDCGSLRLTVGERDIPAAVRALGARRVPTIVLSHPNIDHYSGVLDVITPLGVRRVIVGEGFVRAAEASPTGPAAYVLREVERRGVEVRTVAAGDDLVGELGFARVISPARGATYRADNDMSLMLRVEATDGGANDTRRVVMLTGDAGREALADLMEREPSLRADVIEAPHHGSHNEVAEAFVRGLSPRVVVQSTGPRRLDDPRWAEVRAATSWLATPREGAVSVTVYDDGEITTRAWRRE